MTETFVETKRKHELKKPPHWPVTFKIALWSMMFLSSYFCQIKPSHVGLGQHQLTKL